MKLYKFYWDCGRMGFVSGAFLAKPENISDAFGKSVYFGEILGKHSEISGTFEAKDLEVLDVSDEFIKEFSKHFPDGFGYNPLNYITEND